MEVQIDLKKEFRSQQEKYYYYIIALCIAAIGFSINLTVGKQLTFYQLPIGLAILVWGLSCYCGFEFIGRGIEILHINSELLDVRQGKNKLSGRDPEKIEIIATRIIEIINAKGHKRSRFGKWQVRLFFIGMILFLIGHITQMYNNVPEDLAKPKSSKTILHLF